MSRAPNQKKLVSPFRQKSRMNHSPPLRIFCKELPDSPSRASILYSFPSLAFVIIFTTFYFTGVGDLRHCQSNCVAGSKSNLVLSFTQTGNAK